MKRIIILEGPDGAGKTTLARKLVALRPGCHYHHHGPYRQVQGGLRHLYAQSMAPAVLGRCDVVMDRCWISEKPYGIAFRDGADRLSPADVTELETMAGRCKTTLLVCLPEWDVVRRNFASRFDTGGEYLDGSASLHVVYEWYRTKAALNNLSSLTTVVFDPFAAGPEFKVGEFWE